MLPPSPGRSLENSVFVQAQIRRIPMKARFTPAVSFVMPLNQFPPLPVHVRDNPENLVLSYHGLKG